MDPEIRKYNDSREPGDKLVCAALASAIDAGLFAQLTRKLA